MIRNSVLLAFFAVVLAGCGSSEPSHGGDAAAPEAAVETGDKCTTVRCDASTACDPLDGICKPPNFAKLGDVCTPATCTGTPGATCLEGEYPDGYCSIACSGTNPCPSDASCVNVGGKLVCLEHCGIDADCRGGIEYKCQDVSSLLVSGTSRRVCYLPAFACTTDAQCPTPLKCTDGKNCT